MKLAVLVAVVRVCPSIHKVRIRTWQDSEGCQRACPTSELHRLPVVRLPLVFIRYKFCMISSDIHCQWPTARHQQWEYCISAIKCCSIYFTIMQLTATTIREWPLIKGGVN